MTSRKLAHTVIGLESQPYFLVAVWVRITSLKSLSLHFLASNMRHYILWKPTPVLLPGKSHGWRNLVGCRLWGGTELDTTEAT